VEAAVGVVVVVVVMVVEMWNTYKLTINKSDNCEMN
jgi:hypothetical protein